MGLHNQLTDLSADSIPFLLLAVFANCLGSLRSLLLNLLQSLGLTRFDPDHIDSGLTGLIVLAEQLNLNSSFSYNYSCAAAGGVGKDCMVCLSTFRDGELVRRLDCCHVFHKHCFEGWLNHLNFNCPLCRSPVVSDERVLGTRRRVGEDFVGWLSLR